LGLTTGHSEADLAMNQMKTDVMLEENIYELSKDNLPPDNHADPHGKIMVHSEGSGWHCIHLSKIDVYVAICDYYTFTPPQPPPKPDKHHDP
jgi:hypothetical protein